MRVYLDNCCYNRPYDNQSQVRISLESQAKLHVQDLIREEKLELASSYTPTIDFIHETGGEDHDEYEYC